jgi:hypothetical protein
VRIHLYLGLKDLTALMEKSHKQVPDFDDMSYFFLYVINVGFKY